MPLTVTFYSYKGGVGRTVLAANVAVLLARHGKTLLCDFDLEAPGLHRIADLSTSRENCGGLFEWLLDWQQKRHFDPPTARDLDALARCALPAEKQDRLFVLPAHAAGANPAALYQAIDWSRFLVDDPDLGLAMLRALLGHLRTAHDFRYLVLDARTGITDAGGFLAALLPDVTVLVGNYGAQNTGGLKSVWEGLRAHADDPRRHPVGAAAGELPALRPLEIRLVASPIPDEGPEIKRQLRAIWERDFDLAAGSLIEIPERSDLRRSEAILAIGEADSPVVHQYRALCRELLQVEGTIARDNAGATLAVEQRRDLYRHPSDPRARPGQGKRFEERVADLLRLLGYRVEPEQTLDGNRVDLVATFHQGLDETTYLVECKDQRDAVGTAVVDTLDSWLRRSRASALHARGMIVGRRFSPQAIEAAKAAGIRCFTPDDLERALIDFAPYLNRLLADFANSPLARYYVAQQVQAEGHEAPLPLLDYAVAWANGERSRLWVLLGDYGTGKTAFTRRFAYELAQQALGGGSETAVVPLLINLRDYPNKASLGDIVHEHWHRSTGERRDPAIFLHLLARGRLLLLFDSFDEMGISQAHRNVVEQFRVLAQPTGSAGDGARGNRVLVTCREQFFREHGEAQRAVRGESDRLAALENAARGFDGTIDVLPRFTDAQIQDYLQRRLGEREGGKAWQAIDRIYHLRGLADRPQLLEMIIHSLPELLRSGQTVSAGALYLRYTNRWLEDPAIRPVDRQSSSEQLRAVLEALAVELWRRDGQRIHHVDLYVLIHARSELRGGSDPLVLDVELRTAAFLSRTPDGYYGFSHRSFLEFFYARALLQALHAAAGDETVALPALALRLAGPPPSRELAGFTADLLAVAPPPGGVDFARRCVARLLADAEQPLNARRNAYLLAYWITGSVAPGDKLADELDAWLPQQPARIELAGCRADGLALPGARLAGANLENSVWDGSELGAADLSRISARGASFRRCRLAQATLADADLAGACFDGAELAGARLSRARAAGSSWINGRLTGADLTDADLSRADLRAARLAGSRGRPQLAGARLEGATAPGAECPALPRRPDTSATRLRAVTTFGHHGAVTSVAWSPDGERVLSGGEEGTLCVWDAVSGALLATLAEHESGVTSVAWSPAGGRLLSGSRDRTLRVWDAASGVLLATLAGHQGVVTSVAWSPAGDRVLSGSRDRTLRVWDAASGAMLATLAGHEDEVTSVAWSPAGDRLLSGSEEGVLRVWDAASGALLATLAGRERGVTCVAWSPAGDRLLSGSEEGTLRVWDAASGALLATFARRERSVTCVAWSPAGDRLLSGGWEGTLRVWDAASGTLLATFAGHECVVMSIAWSPAGDRLLSGGTDRTLRVWDAASGALLATVAGHERGVTSVAWSPAGDRLLSGSEEGTLRVWNAASGALLATLAEHERGVTSVAWSPAGDRLLSGSEEGTLRVWNAASGALLVTLAGHERGVTSVAWSPAGDRVLSGGWEDTLRVWDAASGALLATRAEHESGVWSVAWSPAGDRLLSGGWEGTLRVWDAVSGALLATLVGHQGVVTSVAWSPAGDRVLSGGADCTLRVWDAASGALLATLAGDESGVWSLAWSPAGDRVLSGGGDCTLRVWDAASGALLATLAGHESEVRSVAWSPTGDRVLSGSLDGTLRVWDAASGRPLRWYCADGERWFSLDLAGIDPAAASFAEISRPRLRGRGPLPLAFVEVIDPENPLPPAPWIPRYWRADDLPELWLTL